MLILKMSSAKDVSQNRLFVFGSGMKDNPPEMQD